MGEPLELMPYHGQGAVLPGYKEIVPLDAQLDGHPVHRAGRSIMLARTQPHPSWYVEVSFDEPSETRFTLFPGLPIQVDFTELFLYTPGAVSGKTIEVYIGQERNTFPSVGADARVPLIVRPQGHHRASHGQKTLTVADLTLSITATGLDRRVSRILFTIHNGSVYFSVDNYDTANSLDLLLGPDPARIQSVAVCEPEAPADWAPGMLLFSFLRVGDGDPLISYALLEERGR